MIILSWRHHSNVQWVISDVTIISSVKSSVRSCEPKKTGKQLYMRCHHTGLTLMPGPFSSSSSFYREMRLKLTSHTWVLRYVQRTYPQEEFYDTTNVLTPRKIAILETFFLEEAVSSVAGSSCWVVCVCVCACACVCVCMCMCVRVHVYL